MENKQHFKMYKSGKLWTTALITTVLFGAAIMQNETVHADATVPVTTSQVAAATSNQVPQDTTTQNNQVNANQGNLDHYALTENQSGQTQLQASGWHATGQSNQDAYRYLLVFDNSQGREITRQRLTPQQRPDVHQVYQNIDNSLNSGFNTTITIPNSAVSDSLSLISRYSSDPVGGEGNHVDYWFGPLTIDHSNRANLDGLSSDGRTLTVSGWHATNQAGSRSHHYIIAFDQTQGHELARAEVKAGQARPDVAQAFSTIANAGRSGFSVQFALTQPYFNDNIQFVSRWTDDPAGNGNAVDYWFNPITKVNRANLDGYNLSSGALRVAGWHADDISLMEPNHFLIVVDNTTKSQVAAAKVGLKKSTDVAKVFNDTKTAGQSRFNYVFSNLNLVNGHDYSLVSRYSSSNTGNGGSGAYTDSWLHIGTLNQAASFIDGAQVDHRALWVSGWMANDQSLTKPYAYAILLQNGREIGRQQLRLSERDDVAQAMPQIYRSQFSGFNTTFTLPSDSLANLQLVLRFTDDLAGNGHSADCWVSLRQTTSAAQTLQRALADKASADNAVKNAQADLNTAQQAVDNLHDGGVAIQQAANKVTAAQSAKTSADNDVNAKQSAVNTAQNKLNKDQAALVAASTDVKPNGDDSTNGNLRLDDQFNNLGEKWQKKYRSVPIGSKEAGQIADEWDDAKSKLMDQWNKNVTNHYLNDDDVIPAGHTLTSLSDSYQSDPALRRQLVKVGYPAYDTYDPADPNNPLHGKWIKRQVYPADNRGLSFNASVNATNYLLELINPIRQVRGLAPLITDSQAIRNAAQAVTAMAALHDNFVYTYDGIQKQYGFMSFDTDADNNSWDLQGYNPLGYGSKVDNNSLPNHGWISVDNLHRAIFNHTYKEVIQGQSDGLIGDANFLLDRNVQSLAVQVGPDGHLYSFLFNPASHTDTTALQQAVFASKQALSQAQAALTQAKATQSQSNTVLQQAQTAYNTLTNGAKDPATLQANLTKAKQNLVNAQEAQAKAAQAVSQAQNGIITLEAR